MIDLVYVLTEYFSKAWSINSYIVFINQNKTSVCTLAMNCRIHQFSSANFNVIYCLQLTYKSSFGIDEYSNASAGNIVHE